MSVARFKGVKYYLFCNIGRPSQRWLGLNHHVDP